MASLVTNKRKTKPNSYTVKWVIGGGRPKGVPGEWGIETFDPIEGEHRNEAHAKLFRAAVEAAHHQWPANYVPGTGFVDPVTYQAVLAAAAREQANDEPATTLRLADYIQTYLAKKRTESDFGQVRKYGQMLRDFVEPWFGERDLLDPLCITRDEIEAWALELRAGERAEPETPPEDEDEDDVEDDEDYDEVEPAEDEDPEKIVWLRAPKSPKTIRNIHAAFSAVLTFRMRDSKLPVWQGNPCHGAKLPKLEDDEGDEEMVYLDPDEFAILLSAMKQDARALTKFLFATGLRFGEATALKVKDFARMDPDDHPRFYVRRAWKQRENGSWYLGRPKTAKGKRWISLTKAQAEEILELIAGRGKSEFLFTGPRGGHFTHSTYYSERWRHAVYAAMRCPECRAKDYQEGIGRRGGRNLRNEHVVWCGHQGTLQERPRPHDLRHSHVSCLIELGTHVKKISERLGHASIIVTMDRYGHLFPEIDEILVAGMEGILERVARGMYETVA